MAEKAEDMMRKGSGRDQDAEQGQQPEPGRGMQTAQDMINKQRGGEQDQAQDAGQQSGSGQSRA